MKPRCAPIVAECEWPGYGQWPGAWHHPCACATPRMRHVAIVLLVVGSLAALPRRAPAQQAARDLATFTLVSGTRRQYRSVAATLLTMPSQQRASSGMGPLAARMSWSTLGIAELPARRSWTASHTALASAFTVVLLVDAAQTRDLARRGWPGFREANPLLGPRPSVGQVNTYTALAAAGMMTAAAAAPPRIRPWLLGAALAVEALTVGGSVRNGLPLRIH